jgi:hypothetical protein
MVLEIRRSEVVHTRGNRGVLQIRRLGSRGSGLSRVELDLRRLGSASPRGRLTAEL